MALRTKKENEVERERTVGSEKKTKKRSGEREEWSGESEERT